MTARAALRVENIGHAPINVERTAPAASAGVVELDRGAHISWQVGEGETVPLLVTRAPMPSRRVVERVLELQREIVRLLSGGAA